MFHRSTQRKICKSVVTRAERVGRVDVLPADCPDGDQRGQTQYKRFDARKRQQGSYRLKPGRSRPFEDVLAERERMLNYEEIITETRSIYLHSNC